VDGAEDSIEPVSVALATFDRGELLFKLVHELGAFVEISGLEVV
jgi:hypothetical protein